MVEYLLLLFVEFVTFDIAADVGDIPVDQSRIAVLEQFFWAEAGNVEVVVDLYLEWSLDVAVPSDADVDVLFIQVSS